MAHKVKLMQVRQQTNKEKWNLQNIEAERIQVGLGISFESYSNYTSYSQSIKEWTIADDLLVSLCVCEWIVSAGLICIALRSSIQFLYR